MSTVSAKIDIDAPIERVWETVMDPHRLGDWVTIHKSVSDVSDLPLRRGSTMQQAMHVRGLTFHVHWTLTAVDNPRRAEWEGEGPARSTAVIRYELSSADQGPTTFEYTNEFHPPGGRLGSVAGRMIVGATSQREANHSLSRLKALLERK
ncbi:MAG: SRPBCC family protein [Solirubrobacteraceae bacterium]